MPKLKRKPQPPKSCPSRLRIFAAAGSVQLQAAEGDGEKKIRKFSMLAYTGGKMNIRGFFYPVVVDLAGLTVTQKPRPILRDHDPSRIVGHTESVKVGGRNIAVTGVISAANEHAREVQDSADNGFPWQASIGASVQKLIRVDDGEKVVVNGRTFVGPVYVARQATLGEISFVALGADDNTSAQIAASAAGPKIEVIEMDFEQWLQAKGFELNDLSETQVEWLKAQWEREQEGDQEPPTKPPKKKRAAKKKTLAASNSAGDEEEEEEDEEPQVDPIKAMRSTAAAELKRINAIRKVCGGQHADVEAKAIEEGWDVNRTELEVLRASRPNPQPLCADDSNGRSYQALEAALCLSAGLPEEQVGKWYGEKSMNRAVSRDLRGAGIRDVFCEVIRADGGHLGTGRLDNEFIRAAFHAERNLQASGGFSTISLSGILGNVANKAMLAAYQAVASVVHEFCAARDVNDFKQVTSFRLTGNGVFEKVGPSGELTHATLSEESYHNQVETFGRIITLTRQMIINDDLGAFLQLPRLIGRMSALRLQEEVYGLLLANINSFFGVGNNNYFEGADSALSIGSLTVAEQMFMDQVDSDGKPVAITPAILLVPTGLKVAANQLYTSLVVNETTTANKPRPADNPHAGKFKPVASPYLNNAAISGSSATAWYLFANPADVAAMEVAYLRGRRVPVIESGETSFNTLGMQWRGYFDFGVAMQDPRAAVKSKGAA